MAFAQTLHKGFAYRVVHPFPNPEWLLYMDVALVRGRLECTRLMVEPINPKVPQPITTSVLRGFQMPELIKRFTSTINVMLESSGASPDALISERSRRGRPLERDPKVVARVYTNALAQREPPTQAVAAHFNISPSAAAKAVYTARRRGYLAPTRRGVAAASDAGSMAAALPRNLDRASRDRGATGLL